MRPHASCLLLFKFNLLCERIKFLDIKGGAACLNPSRVFLVVGAAARAIASSADPRYLLVRADVEVAAEADEWQNKKRAAPCGTGGGGTMLANPRGSAAAAAAAGLHVQNNGTASRVLFYFQKNFF